MNTACTQRSQCKSRYICVLYIYIHTQEKLGELMGPSKREWSLLREEEDEEATQQERDSGLQAGRQKGVPGFEKSHDFAWGGQWAGIRACRAGHWCMGSCMPFLCVRCALQRTGQLASISGTWGRKQELHPHPPQAGRETDEYFFYWASICKNTIVVYTSIQYISTYIL